MRPVGVRVARLLCPKAGVTISLLPDFLASRLSGTLSEVEAVVEAAENAASQEAALEQARPAAAPEAVTLPSGLRWLRRRLSGVHAALIVAVTLVPSLAGCRPTLAALRERLSVSEVLLALRRVVGEHLSVMSRPLGFRARARQRNRKRKRTPHEVGPDPPGRDR
jgi:small-conductance mechanosensitive channel